MAGVYGMLHDQISFSISSEYFTKFKFQQFHIETFGPNNLRLSTAIIGFMSTWWTGLLVGVVFGIIGLFMPNTKLMRKSILGASVRAIAIAFGVGLLGILIGKFIVSALNFDWSIPNGVADKNAFLIVGTMHTASYIGAIIGLIFGAIYQLRLRNKTLINCK